ncbi:MAG TPA: glutaredoxin family protein [Candidatus Nanoarchaeia archaeon]|nr:glutaredoxin family protein [Candidatus Nanoarchaeia archaeon]
MRGGNISYQTHSKKVAGKKIGDIFIFALSTCIWCRKTKQLFKELGVEYSYVDVDMLQGKDQDEAMKEMGKWSNNQSFPMIVLDKKKSILGFKEQEIRDYCGRKK